MECNPLVSIVILNFDGIRSGFLSQCLDSLLKQNFPNIEIIVVDNASKDDSVDFVSNNYPGVKIIANQVNVGFCEGNNIGFDECQGDYVLFANNDTVFNPGCIYALVEAINLKPQVGSVSPKIVRPAGGESRSRYLDSAGLTLRRDFTLVDRGFGENDNGQYNIMDYIFGVCGAAAFYRKDILDEIRINSGDVWDRDFFAYYEDGDLAWRMQHHGYQCLYQPQAVVEHYRGGTYASAFFSKQHIYKVHTIKNRYLMLFKNMTISLLLRNIPWIIYREILIWGYMLLHPGLLLDVLISIVRFVPLAIKKRRNSKPWKSIEIITTSRSLLDSS